MKKAPPVRLSLRKLFVAMLAVGPLAILPSPVLASLPTTLTSNTQAPFNSSTIIQVSGTGNLTTTTDTATINVSDRSVLVWGPGAFNIAGPSGALPTGEQYTFLLNGGSVLNKVGYLPSGAASGLDTA